MGNVRRGKQPLLLIKNKIVQLKEEFPMENSIPIHENTHVTPNLNE